MSKIKDDEKRFLAEVTNAVESIFGEAMQEEKKDEKLPVYIVAYFHKERKLLTTLLFDTPDDAFAIAGSLNPSLVNEMLDAVVKNNQVNMQNTLHSWLAFMFPDVMLGVEIYPKRSYMYTMSPEKYDLMSNVEKKSPIIIRQGSSGFWEMIE